MKRIVAVTSLAVVFAALSAVPVPGQAQGAKPQTAGAGPQEKQVRPVAAKRNRSRTNVDARHCLQFSTNAEIHRCAHKYL